MIKIVFIKEWSFTLFTYEQLESAFLKQGYCIGNNSCEAERSAEAAIIDGLNPKSSTSANNRRFW